MNVLYLTSNPNRASSTVPTEGWFRHLMPRGLSPVLVSHQAGAFHAWALEQGIPANVVPMPFPSKTRPWPFFRSLWSLSRIVRRHAIQLIHCNEHGVYPIGQYLARWCRLPIVVGVHSEMSPGYFRWAFAGARRPQRVFFISKASRELTREGIEPAVPESDWRILYNGIDLERVRPTAERRQAFRTRHDLEGKVALGVACAIRPGKQLEHLVELGQRLTGDGWRMVLAGGGVAGEEAYAKGFLAMAREHLGEKLLYLGHLDDVCEFYNGLDVLVNTSKTETCSITILEALACGCPVVGYPSDSVAAQVLPDGGEIVPQNDIAALQVAVERWLEDGELRARSRLLARRRAEQDFDIRAIAEQLWREYHEVIEEYARRGRAGSG